MVAKSTRSSINKQRTTPSVTGRETGDCANVNASEEGTVSDIEAGGAIGAEIGTDSVTGITSTTKVRHTKKKTSPVWKHFNEIYVEEKVDDMVIKKPMASCLYCEDVLCAPSKQGTHVDAGHDSDSVDMSEN